MDKKQYIEFLMSQLHQQANHKKYLIVKGSWFFSDANGDSFPPSVSWSSDLNDAYLFDRLADAQQIQASFPTLYRTTITTLEEILNEQTVEGGQ